MHHFIIYFVGILIYRVGTATQKSIANFKQDFLYFPYFRVGTVYFTLFSFTFPFGLPLLPVLTERPHVDLECPSRPLLLGDPPVGLGDVLWVHVLPALLRPCSHLVKEQIQKNLTNYERINTKTETETVRNRYGN